MNQNILNEYSLKETIGKGSFSKVKLGINKLTGEKVAIKILDKKKIKINSERKRIQRELNIIKKLNHINIIKIFQIKEDTNNIYIIMEYIENNLFLYIINNKSLSEKECSYYFFQLICGLDYIHSQGIVHRDLKPENILLTKKRLLKIIDFGLSNYFTKGKLLSTSCGSPSYTAPEILLGKKYDGFASDIWMIGIILFVMVCGYLPFEEKDDKNNLFKKIVKGKVEYPKFISSDVKNLLQKILVVNPDKRISLNEIKQHQFYLNGKYIFFQNFPELKNKIEINTNKENLLKTKKELPNFDLLRKILNRKIITKEEKENNKDNNKNNYKRKNISPLKLLYKLNKEKQIYKNKYLLTDENEKNNRVIYHKKVSFNDMSIRQSIDFDNSKKHIITRYKNKESKEKQKYKHIKGRNNKTSIINYYSLNIRTSSEKNNLSKYNSIKSNKAIKTINDYAYNNSEMSLNNKKSSIIKKEYKLYDNRYNNSFSNRKTKNYFCPYDNNSYKNKKKNLSLKNNKPKKINSPKQISKINNMYNSLLYNKPEDKDMNKVYSKYLTIAKERREIKNSYINYINESLNKRKVKNNDFKYIITFDYKTNSAKNIVGNNKKKLNNNHKKKKNKKEDKYNIKEIIKRRGLDLIINKS